MPAQKATVIKTKQINNFIRGFDSTFKLYKRFIIEKRNRFFLTNDTLNSNIRKSFFYLGAYLGKVKDGNFFPSFIFLSMMAGSKGNKVIVDNKTAWLFICGRDVFKRGIIGGKGSRKKGYYTLVLNRNTECLGFGKILHDINREIGKDEVIVKNISNIGDFLKRENSLPD